MSRLDCENIVTLEKSIENIFSLSTYDVDKIFNATKRNSNDISSCQLLRTLREKSNNFTYISTSWFHCTRIFPDDNFDEGLLPLSKMTDSIWEKLYYLVKNRLSINVWQNFREIVEDSNYYDQCSGAEQYRDKVSNFYDNDGPYGFLVYNIDCFDKPISAWHYIADGPEIVYHICASFKEIYKWDLFDKFVKNTSPIIVKFHYDVAEYDMLRFALNILFCYKFKREIAWDSNPCYSTRGVPIPSKDIEKIIYL